MTKPDVPDPVEGFYDRLAEHYHLIFENWEASIEWQAGVLGPLLERETIGSSVSRGLQRPSARPVRILDCCCGIGTQAIGLARRGHQVTASDASAAAVARARIEAAQRSLDIVFHVADMRKLEGLPSGAFDVVLTADNALPHLMSDDDLQLAAGNFWVRLVPGGILLATIRDYDHLLAERPTMQKPVFNNDSGQRRFVHQVWDWVSERCYTLHLYITWETAGRWACRHYVSAYRALKQAELSGILVEAGFRDIRWLQPAESGYYQPLVIARK